MTNTTIDPRYIAEARELLAAWSEDENGSAHNAKLYRKGHLDDNEAVQVLARVLSERPVYTRGQKLAAMEQACHEHGVSNIKAGLLLDAYEYRLTAPPVDPLDIAFDAAVEACRDGESLKGALRKVLEARGLKIVEVEG